MQRKRERGCARARAREREREREIDREGEIERDRRRREREREREREMGTERARDTSICRYSITHDCYTITHEDCLLLLRVSRTSAELSSAGFPGLRPSLSSMGPVRNVIVHTVSPPSPVILWIALGGKPKWFLLNSGYHEVSAHKPHSQ